jgi:hypothetical protein
MNNYLATRGLFPAKAQEIIFKEHLSQLFLTWLTMHRTMPRGSGISPYFNAFRHDDNRLQDAACREKSYISSTQRAQS